ncbi:MAG: REP-associated tyrosine transposase [Gaiellaceae bacterium]
MPRPPRVLLPHGSYHVVTRGTARASIFLDDDDRRSFLALLWSTSVRLGWTCHAYCLMTNHYHLVLEAPAPNLSRGLQRLNGVYAQSFNNRHGRVGHLFQGRFWSLPIETEEQFAETCDYVLLNPVRAGLCELATDWRWSGGAVRDMSGV